MARKGFSIARLNAKIAIMFIVPLIVFSQVRGPTGSPLIDANDLNPLIWAKNFYRATTKHLMAVYTSTKSFIYQSKIVVNQHDVIYRWQDSFGNWHYSQQPPVMPVTFETVVLKDNSTRIPKPDDRLTAILSANDRLDKVKPSKPTHPLSLSPDSIKNLLRNTKDIEKTISDRNKQLEKL